MRFLAHKLDLDEAQIAVVAAILDDLKTERAQAAVDDRRAQKLFSEAVSGDGFDEAKAASGAEQRTAAAQRTNQAVVDALKALHAELEADQREQLALLIRTGPIAF